VRMRADLHACILLMAMRTHWAEAEILRLPLYSRLMRYLKLTAKTN